MKSTLSAVSNASLTRTRVRWIVTFMLWLVVAINYLDRAVLSVAMPKMVEEFHFSTQEMGILLSAFFWAYALLQMPAGWLADKIGQKKTLSIAVVLWSVATITTSFVTGFKSLIAFRLGLGVGEAGAYPSNAGIVAKWFPDRERATVSGIFDSAAAVGAALCLPLIVWLIASAGWRTTFILTGLTGIVWLIGWLYFFTDDPRDHKMVNEAELQYIVDGQRISIAADERNKIRWYELLKYRNVWSVSLGLFVGSYNSYFFITWFPIYLVTQKHVSFLHMGMFASLPPLAGMCSELFTGWLSDRLLAKGILSLTAVRKLFLITGMILATAICFAAFADSATVAVALLCVAKMGGSMTLPQLWAIPGDIAPKNAVSTMAGLQNTFSNFGGAIGPIITGFLVAASGSFTSAMLFSGAMVIFNIFNYLFLMKKLTPITARPTEVQIGQQA